MCIYSERSSLSGYMYISCFGTARTILCLYMNYTYTHTPCVKACVHACLCTGVWKPSFYIKYARTSVEIQSQWQTQYVLQLFHLFQDDSTYSRLNTSLKLPSASPDQVHILVTVSGKGAVKQKHSKIGITEKGLKQIADIIHRVY